MKNKVYIITNESFSVDINKNFCCDNIDLKSIPENFKEFSDVNIIGRLSEKARSKKIELKDIKLSRNIFSYLFELHKSFKEKNIKYLIISLSPYTFLASLLLKIFFKKHFIYLRSDGFEEYKAIIGKVGILFYYLIFRIGIVNSKLIACRKHLLKEKDGLIVSPSQLKKKWFENVTVPKLSEVKFLYVGRVRVEKGIFSLIDILRNTNFNLTIVTSEKDQKLNKNYDNVKIVSFENYNDAIIKFYDEHSIFILPSFTEAHPQVLDEALARCRPVIIFKDIEHVKRDREGVFVCNRDLKSLEKTVDYIKINYTKIQKKISNNKLPTQKNFINELKMFLFKDEY